MPGILPMKMIRVGVSTQNRIAQACDRCRSKKIRCDGVRPCCTQCANVGFECKTSDKLSRRAFPRGYTESLEDRVRGLEAEVRELKALLDEKDEKIDMLSRIHNFSRPHKQSVSSNGSIQVKAEDETPRSDIILVELPAAVQPATSSTGSSTTSALIEAFEEKVHDSRRTCPTISTSILLEPQHLACKAAASSTSNNISAVPPRLLSDQYINLFFQEWQPLLPILHRPTFLRTYEQYLSDSDARAWQTNRQAVAQLFLIFEIAAHSSSSKAKPATTIYELQWRKALSAVSSAPSITTLQCHILAQLSYLLKADYPHLLRHRAYAVSTLHQLCLHQGHKSHSLPALEAETRKKVFWCQYVLDKFASAATGTPQLLHDSDISVEFPADVDDENLSAQGFSPVLPGEITKISSALALFRIGRILAKALGNLYPSKATYQLSLTALHSLSDELDQWQEELPDHLRLRFHNDKPATNTISCRSPLLSMAYFYTRSLIHRPLLCYGSGNAVSAASIVIAAAAKHQLQIIDLLDERSMNYTFPINKQDLLLNAGFAVLWQTLNLGDDSKLIKDNRRSLNLLVAKLARENSTASSDFKKIASAFIPLQDVKTPSPYSSADLSDSVAVNGNKSKSARKQLQALASRLSFTGKQKNEGGSTRPGLYQSLSPEGRANSSVSLSSTRSAPVPPTPPALGSDATPGFPSASAINLDYFPFSDNLSSLPTNNSSSTMLPPRKASPMPTETSAWERVISAPLPDSPDMFSTISPSALNRPVSVSGHPSDWSGDLWQVSAYDLIPKAGVAQSLFSFSEESLTSGDDLLFSTTGSHNGSTSTVEGADVTANISSDDPYGTLSIGVDDAFAFPNL